MQRSQDPHGGGVDKNPELVIRTPTSRHHSRAASHERSCLLVVSRHGSGGRVEGGARYYSLGTAQMMDTFDVLLVDLQDLAAASTRL